MWIRNAVMLTHVAGLCALIVSGAFAQETFPSRPLKIVMPLPAGAGPDVRIRIIAEHLSGVLGQRVIVENQPGAGGRIGAQAVITSPADGYTLLAAPGSIFTILPAQKDKLPFDVNRDLIPIGSVASEPLVLAVSPNLGITSLQDFIDRGKSKPDTLIVGTNPTGSLPHLAAKLLAARSSAPIVILPYATGGTNEAIRDIMGGRVHAVIESLAALRGVLASKDVMLISTMSDHRLTALPEVPAAAETLPGLTATGWVALFTPKDVPEAAVKRITDALRVTLQDQRVRTRLHELGTPFEPLYGPELAAFITRDQALWLPLASQP
jgi:tripartite-type tricarboxylate transporter receptor subunit TctC